MPSYRFIDKDPIIDVVRTAIQAMGWSHAKLARESGLAETTISAWLDGETKNPQNASVDICLRVMGIDRRPRWNNGSFVDPNYVGSEHAPPELRPSNHNANTRKRAPHRTVIFQPEQHVQAA